MVFRDNRAEYERRIHRVLAHIDAHLEQPLDLNTLAELTHFSPFHFHRIFSAWMGETLGDYLRRRRVEVAAMRLAAQPRTRILDAALSVGFGSAEAFSRAFKARFKASPSAWKTQQTRQRRENSNPDQVHSKLSQAAWGGFGHHEHPRHLIQEPPMNVKLIDRPTAHIAYFRHLGPYGEAVSRFWQEIYAPWARAHRLGPDHARYGISYDDPSITAPERCRYDACAEVDPSFIASGGALQATLPGGRYAVLPFKGSAREISDAWAALLRDWLPASGYQLDARPCFEYYPKGAARDPVADTFECELCIPVTPLS